MVEREHIGIFGKVNSGKSSLMNLITQQETSIVDPTPGTTADAKIALFELHGIGPLKIYDTAGLDEMGELGDKKRKKTLDILKECDLVSLVIDPSTSDFSTEKMIIDEAENLDKQVLVLYNLFKDSDVSKISLAQEKLPDLKYYKSLSIKMNEDRERPRLLGFLLKNYEPKNSNIELLPFLQKDEFYVLNIPMDTETPQGRYLRPQMMVEEYITRNWAYPVSYRMDLGKARNPETSIEEKQRFYDFLNNFKRRPKAIITDSQAMDIMSKWTPSDIGLTTFSITMINYLSKGKLNQFVDALKAVDELKPGDKVLIAEACNHSRIGDDIGTVQIPTYMQKKFPGVTIEHNFGREFMTNENLSDYKLILHCGGCMISQQKMSARLRDLGAFGVPITNYGLFLSYAQGKEALKKVLEPWGVKI